MIIHCRYEEYPTTPPLFVLNGFIYSLFGLYDLAQLGEGEMKVTAQKLYDEGMKSLKVMLPLFDSGKDITASRIIELIRSPCGQGRIEHSRPPDISGVDDWNLG